MNFKTMSLVAVLVCAGCSQEPEADTRACFPDGVMLEGRVCADGMWQELDASQDLPTLLDMGSRDLAVEADLMQGADLVATDQPVDLEVDASDSGLVPDDMDAGIEEMPPEIEVLPECTHEITDLAALQSKLSEGVFGGDVLCLADGTWEDVDVLVSGQGQQGAPVILRAKNPGNVIITGKSALRMAGSHVWVHGLVFDGGESARSSLIAFREDSSTFCTDCRLSDVTIRRVDQMREEGTKWVSLYGQRNRVDHCWFEHKRNEGALLVVWRPEGAPPDEHLVEHNYFYDRPPLGRNGAEAIRVGTSDTHMTDSLTVVQHNLFERMNGEIEIISNKSGGNRYLFNTFLQSAGTLTMRHGKNAHIEGNIFITGGVDQGAGIRLIDSGHVVINNYIEGVRFGSSFRGGIVMVGGQPDAPVNGYQPVEDVLVAFNTIVDSEQSFIFGGGDSNLTIPPKGVTLVNNLVARGKGEAIRTIHGLDAPTFAGNLIEAEDGLGIDPVSGLELSASLLERRAGLWRPTSQSPTRDAAQGMVEGVVRDIDGVPRVQPFDVGADEDVRRDREVEPLTSDDVGPRDYRP